MYVVKLFPTLVLRLNKKNEHSSFSNFSIPSPTSQLILQPFSSFTYVTTHSPTLPLLHLRHSSFSKPFRRFTYVTAHSPNHSVALPTSQLILQPFSSFTYVTAHSPNHSVALPTSQNILQTIPSLYLRHSSFSKPFRCFTYVTAHSPTLPLFHLRHSSFSNPSFASPKSQVLHLIHLASC